MRFINNLKEQQRIHEETVEVVVKRTNNEIKKIMEQKERRVICSECFNENDEDAEYCTCGHKLKHIDKSNPNYKEYCPICKDEINSDMNYCGKYGHKIERGYKEERCSVCGTWNKSETYCINCGHKLSSGLMGYGLHVKKNKKCPHCFKIHPKFHNYCILCGTKLEKI